MCYADDICLVSISAAGMQKLLNICNEFASENDLLFNKKTVCMNFKPSKMKMKDPTLYLNNEQLNFEKCTKYLGIFY